MTIRRFGTFACLDWSGAVGPRQPGIALARCDAGRQAPELVTAPGGWSRQAALDWLLERVAERADMLIGIDFSAAFPFADRGAYFPGLPHPPCDAPALWAFIDRLAVDDPHLAANTVVDHPDIAPHFRRSGGRLGAAFGVGGGRLRVVERRCRDRRQGAAQSCFNLVGAAQVGKSSLTGMRVLHRLRGRIPFWPFDPVPDDGPLIVEIYTSLAARTAGVPVGRSKVRDAASLDAALATLGSTPHTPLTRYDDHATDALLTAAWLRRAAPDVTLWYPSALTEAIARTEGWTFGVR